MFLTKYLNLNMRTLNLNHFIILLGISLAVFIPELRTLILAYTAIYLLAENMSEGTQAEQTNMLTALPLLVISTLAGILIFSTIKTYLNPSQIYNIPGVTIIGWIFYFFYVAIIEEAVFRQILPRSMNNLIIPQIIYVVFHALTITMTAQTFNLLTMIPYFIFTFIFATFMSYLTYKAKTTAPAVGVHFTYDLFKKGILQSMVM